MFVRKKKNPSGVISVQIIDKTSGEYRVVKTMGSTSDPETVELLFRQGKNGFQTVFMVKTFLNNLPPKLKKRSWWRICFPCGKYPPKRHRVNIEQDLRQSWFR